MSECERTVCGWPECGCAYTTLPNSQSSTAGIDAAPSQEGVGQGGIAGTQGKRPINWPERLRLEYAALLCNGEIPEPQRTALLECLGYAASVEYELSEAQKDAAHLSRLRATTRDEWHEWAKAQAKAGLKQSQCPVCHLWKFPQEKCNDHPHHD